MKDAYDNYSLVLSNLLNDKAKNINDTIQEELNKLNNLFYYGSTFQKRFDNLHSDLMKMCDILISDIEQQKLENTTLYYDSSLQPVNSYNETVTVFNAETGNYEYFYNTKLFSKYLFPKDEVSLKEYLNVLKKYLYINKYITDENIKRIITENCILTDDDRKDHIDKYLDNSYYLLASMNYKQNNVHTKLPMQYRYIIDAFAKYYFGSGGYWPKVPADFQREMKNKNIRFDKLLDE